eukprot:CAMPEP_0177611856 /NCGR_PEP_ID=MMETSP0419_2-20121207/20812_1 /TAXON_ID=582737 /ORGANISM="Tetraselmis sp., Strain GSL018" /LENGTH=804 /DNA_ID=CAMNT_0019107809 /DNA_START=226 /DNA_END=2636 /DNA_ORIENTATION=+
MTTRIPRVPLTTVDPNTLHNKGTKPDAEKPSERISVKRQRTEDSSRSLQDQEGWEAISASTGLTVQGLLDTKMTGKNKHDLKGKLEQCMGYIKQLRACVRYLDTEAQMLEADRDSLEASMLELQQEKEGEAASAKQREAGLGQELSDKQQQLAEAGEALQELERCKLELEGCLRDSRAANEQSAERMRSLEAELQRVVSQQEDVQKQASHAQDQYNKAQEYIANLQEYNAQKQRESIALNNERAALQEEHKALSSEVARLTASNTVTQAQLESCKADLIESQGSRAAAQDECMRLRTELLHATTERDTLASQLAEATAKLKEFESSTGRVMTDLQAVTKAKEDLEEKSASQEALVRTLREELADVGGRSRAALEEGAKLSAAKSALEQTVAELQSQLRVATGQIHAHEAHRRKLHNTIQDMKGNIRVFCRLRPHVEEEGTGVIRPLLEDGSSHGTGVEVTMPGTEDGHPGPQHLFTFDRVFGPAASQDDVFLEISQLVQSALDGQKVCIFAYGQTGSGKTHTMLGEPENPGMIPRAMDKIFESSRGLQAQGWEFRMRASMMEIYNEEYRDLLGKGAAPPRGHKVVHDACGNTTVSDLTVIDVMQSGGVETLMKRALSQRSIGATALNERSSRSHCVFTLRIEGSCQGTGESSNGVLNLIDLAGSERLSKSMSVGDRLKETQAINKSLSALGDVICAIGSKAEHIPYRNSKLTWFLQPCLGGGAKTLMFVNLSPASQAAGESLCSLRFASKVNACEIGAAEEPKRSAEELIAPERSPLGGSCAKRVFMRNNQIETSVIQTAAWYS